jgi:hypothetical protein
MGIAIIVAVTSSDWPWGILGNFWLKHGLFASVVSGLLLLTFAALVIDSWIGYREDRRWAAVSNLAYLDLARVCQDFAILLEWLLGNDNGDEGLTQLRQDDRETLRQMTAGTEGMDPVERLQLLTANRSWLAFREREEQRMMDRSRGVIRTWAPSMAQSKSLAAILDDVIGLMDQSSGIDLLLLSLKPPRKSLAPVGELSSRGHGDLDLNQLAVEWMATVEGFWRLRRFLRDQIVSLV